MRASARRWTSLARCCLPGFCLPGFSLVAPSLSAAPATCASALRIASPAALAGALERELASSELSRHSAEPCLEATVTLVPEAGQLRLLLDVAGRRTSRSVRSVADAAVWLESWLAPEAPPVASDAPSRTSTPPLAARAELSAGADAKPNALLARGRVGVLARASFDSGAAQWGGLEVFGALDLGGPFWMGAGIGRSWDPVLGQSELGARVRRHTTHAVVRAGGAWPLAGRSEFAVGAGLGIMSAFVSGPALVGGNRTTDNEGVGVLEICPQVRVPLAHALELAIGFEIERTLDFEAPDAQEPSEPVRRAYPEWRGSLVLGAAFRFGRE